MNISNSKKQLAKIIHENGGWREGATFAAQDMVNMVVDFYERTPIRDKEDDFWHLPGRTGVFDKVQARVLIRNWHQTLLSRDEYLHLYPVAEAAPEPVSEAKPTIEQLAADYRNCKDYADRKQQEADAAKADAEDKLAELVAAGEALGLVLSAAGAKPELVITDWRDLRVGDVIEVTGSSNEDWRKVKGEELTVNTIRKGGASTGRWLVRGNTEFRLIRRPTKGGENA